MMIAVEISVFLLGILWLGSFWLIQEQARLRLRAAARTVTVRA